MYVDGCCKNLYGSPPKEIYIYGYSIVLTNKDKSYPFQIICSIFARELPNSTYIINIEKTLVEENVYLNLNKMSSKFILDMYKKGIYTTKNQLE